MNQLQKTFKYLKEKNGRADRYDIIPAVKCWSADRRVSQLLKLWLVEKRVLWQGTMYHEIKTEYKITELWLNTNVIDVKVPSTPKTKKTRAESEAKKQAKDYNIQERTPRIIQTTLLGKLQYLWSEINFLFFTKHNEKST